MLIARLRHRTLAIRIVAVLLVLGFTRTPARGDDPQAQAERFVSATWTHADEVAKMLVIRDFFEAVNEMTRQASVTAGAVSTQETVLTVKKELVTALEAAASVNPREVAQSEEKLKAVLNDYRSVVARRYRLSWYSANSIIESQALAQSVGTLAKKMRQRCEQGSSSGGDDFFTAARPALPQLDLGFNVHATFSETGAGGVDQAVVGTGSKKHPERDAINGAILGLSSYCGPWYLVCSAGGLLVASGVYAFLDMNEQHDELAAIARAEAYRLNKRAVASDVNALYRKHCGHAVSALEEVETAVNMTAQERDEYIAQTDTEAFRQSIARYKAENEAESLARCRVAAARHRNAGSCATAGTVVVQPRFDDAPQNCSATGGDVQCPQRVVSVDNGCRVLATGETAMYPVRWVTETSVVLQGTPICQVQASFDTKADEAALLDIARRRSDVREMQIYSANVGRHLALEIIKTLQDPAKLASIAESGEADLDRQQQYALTNIVRLLHYVRVRKRLLASQAELAAMQPPAEVRQVVERFAQDSGRILASSITLDRKEPLAQQLESLETNLAKLEPRTPQMAKVLRDIRVSALQLRLLAR